MFSNPKTNGPGYIDAHKVGPSGPPPPFQPYWVESFQPTPLWSGPAPDATVFGQLPPWHFFNVVEPPAGLRLHVTIDRTAEASWIDAAAVGPSGAPTAPAPGFTDIVAGGRIGQLPGWPRILAQQTESQTLRPGVIMSNVHLLTDTGTLHLHQVQVDLTSPGISVSSVVAHNSVVSTGETVSSMADRTGAIAGINGDYFAIHDSGIPLNLTIQDGNLIRSGNDWAVFGITKDKHIDIGKYAWRGVLSVLRHPNLWFPIEGVNLPLVDGRVVAVTQSMGSVLAATDATLAYLSALPGAAANQYQVRQVVEHQSTVPPVSGATVVLAGEGVGATWLAQYAPAGTHLQLDYRSQPGWQELQTAVGGGPILVKNGAPFQDGDAPASFEADVPYPVSGAGVSRDGRTLWLVVVDGHEGDPAFGLTRSQFAWYFQTIGAWQAMAFDSGGSATLVARRPGQPTATLVNAPSDGQERPVADGLFIYG